MAGLMMFFGAALVVVNLILYIYLVVLAGRFVGAAESMAHAVSAIAERYVNGPHETAP